MRYISKIHVLLCAAALAITACQSEDSISPETDMETVKLLVTVMGHRTKRIRERGDEKHRKPFIYKELRGLRL